MHLALGLGFFFGGINRKKQYYNEPMARILGTGLLLSVAALVIPTVIRQFQIGQIKEDNILSISRSIAVVLLLCYLAFLLFSLRTHADLFRAPSKKVLTQNLLESPASEAKRGTPLEPTTGLGLLPMSRITKDADEAKREAQGQKQEDNEEGEEEESLTLTLMTSVIVIVVATTFLGFCTTFATDSLDGLIARTGLTDAFIGIVLLPLLSVDFTMFALARKDKMDLFLAVTAGKCLQTTLLVIPVVILLGWILDVPIGLDLDPFEAIALYASIVYISNIIQVGESTYLQGVMLLGLYVIICTVSFYLPTKIQ